MITPNWLEHDIQDFSSCNSQENIQPKLNFNIFKVTPNVKNIESFLNDIINSTGVFSASPKLDSKLAKKIYKTIPPTGPIDLDEFMNNIHKGNSQMPQEVDLPDNLVSPFDQNGDLLLDLSDKAKIHYYCGFYGIDPIHVTSITIKREYGSNTHEVTIKKSLPNLGEQL
jgi:hypothetical protein